MNFNPNTYHLDLMFSQNIIFLGLNCIKITNRLIFLYIKNLDQKSLYFINGFSKTSLSR